MVEKGANTNKKTRNKHLIETASLHKNSQIISSFLDTKKEEILSIFGSNCVHLIIQNGDFDSLQKYFSFPLIDVNKKDKFSKSVLDYVVEEEKLDLLKLVLERKADPNLVDRDGNFFSYF